MDTLTKTQVRLETVLARLTEQVRADADMAEVVAEELDNMLENLHVSDFFGTEGQSDPRGDGRGGMWSMSRVQGVDD